jgi:hypothetical protein
LRRAFRRAVVLATLGAAATAATAYAITAEVGPVWVSATATVQPRELPRPGHGNAPITLTSVTRVGTRDGSTPPTLKTILFLLDRNGTIDTRGLPACSEAELIRTTPAQARRRCAGALVGRGTAKVLVTMPGKVPFTVTSPLSFFNGPRSGGRPTLIAHGYETVPAPKTHLVTIAIERIDRGRYGYRVEVDLPEFAGGYGAPLLAEAKIGATRMRGGRQVGYINAHCAGGRLQVTGSARFTNGDFFPVTLTSPCHFPS